MSIDTKDTKKSNIEIIETLLKDGKDYTEILLQRNNDTNFGDFIGYETEFKYKTHMGTNFVSHSCGIF
jgi:hypothetical protein